MSSYHQENAPPPLLTLLICLLIHVGPLHSAFSIHSSSNGVEAQLLLVKSRRARDILPRRTTTRQHSAQISKNLKATPLTG